MAPLHKREMKTRSRFQWFLRMTTLALVATLVSSLSASARSGGNNGTQIGGGLTPGFSVREGGASKSPDRFRVRLRTRSLVPQPGVDSRTIESARRNTIGDRVHYLVQMDPIPRSNERAHLEQLGLRLLSPVGGNTYVASSTVGMLQSVSSLPGVRWAGSLKATDKVPSAVAGDRVGAWARKGSRIILAVTFHPDVSMPDAHALVRALGGRVLSTSPVASIVVASFPRGRAKLIATADPVQFVDAVEPKQRPKNDTSRLATNHAAAAAAPYNDTGAGVIGLVYDGGTILSSHPDFAGRLIETNGSTVSDHSTHVGGTFAGSGANSAAKGGSPKQWAGYAPGAKIRSWRAGAGDFYDNAGATESNLTAAMQSTTGGKGIDLATASLGDTAFPSRGCGVLGDYVNTSILIDKIVRGSINDADGNPQKLIWTFAAGNERIIFPPTAADDPLVCGNFVTLSSPGPAKNTITVGSMNSDDRGVSTFSSWGPTSDGRLKPDISAPGCSSTRGAIISTTSKTTPAALVNGYVQKCGTSMATPAVAGTIALIIEEWRKNHPDSRPLPSTAKAILVHTAATTAVPAFLITGNTAANNAIMYTAQVIAGGNSLSVQYTDPGAPNSPLFTTVTGNAVNVSLATNAAGTITSTAQDVITDVNNNAWNAAGTQQVLRAAIAFGGDFTQPFGGAGDGGLVAAMPATNLSGGNTAATGPDYRFGWGTIDVGAAVKFVADEAKDERITVDTIEHNITQTMNVYSDGTENFKATLAWDDPAGTRLPANALVNNLDLSLVDPSGTPVQPLVLDPTNPLAPAVPGVDTRNNVEVAVGAKKAGMWQVIVTGTSVLQGPQEYTLITPPKGNGISVTPAVVTEGDSGSHAATFVVALTHPDDKTQTATYAAVGGSASSGSDFQSASGTLTFAPGETEKLVPVTVNGDIDDEPTETFTLEITQGSDVVARGAGQIVDDDHDRSFTIVGKTGLSGLQGIEPPTVSINEKGKVVFIGRTTTTNPFGNMGIYVGDRTTPAVNVIPSWSSSSRVFAYPIIANDGSVKAWDRQAGSPPFWFVRRWTKPLIFGDWNQSVLARSGGQFDSVITPTSSLDNGYLAFVALQGGTAAIQWGEDGADGTWTDIQAPAPLLANDGSTVFRQVRKDAAGALDYHNAALQVVNVYGAGTGKIACPAGQACSHPGFTEVGWRPGISQDGKVVAWYGDHDAIAPATGIESGIWASIRSATGPRKLVRVAKIGDAGITAFTDGNQDERIGVNSTQQDEHGVTVVFMATASGHEAIYRAQIVFEGTVASPTGFHVVGPSLLVRTGQNVRDVGVVDDLSLGDRSINNHNQGDIAFYAHAGSVEAALVAEAADVPLLFVPGIGGSKLYDTARNENVWFVSAGSYFFGDRDKFWSKALSLRDEDQTGRTIVPTDAFRTAMGPVGAIYKPLLDYLGTKGYTEYNLGTNGVNLRTCDETQIPAKPNLFIFAYDWRKSNAINAALLNNYMSCVKRFYPDAKVNVLTHSMGGLLTRRAILSQPGFADQINTLTSVVPPWLGAPKLIYVLRSGDFIPGKASGPGVKRAAAALPGAHQLMPSAAGFAVSGTAPYGEENRDFDNNGVATEMYSTFARMKGVLDKAYPRFKPGSAAASFHGTPGQDDWSGDSYGFKFFELYGVQSTPKTINQVIETTKVLCDHAASSTPDTANADPSVTCTRRHPLMLFYTDGDGTVPAWSAARTSAMQPPGATIDAPYTGDDEASHNGILKNTVVQERIKQILIDNDGPPDPTAPPAPSPSRLAPAKAATRAPFSLSRRAAAIEMHSVAVYGASGLVATDDAGHSTEVTTDSSGDPVESPIPGLDTYVIDDDARLLRSSSPAPLTVTFAAAGPIEVDVTTEDGTGAVTEATRYLDVGLPNGTPVQLTSSPGSAPSLAYDADGDGTYEASAAVDVHVTGAAANDNVGPTIDVQKTVADDGLLDVTIVATDSGSGVNSVRYSLDGETFKQYTGPFRVDPAENLVLEATAEDNAGNRTASERIRVGAAATQSPDATGASVATDEDSPVDIVLGASELNGFPLHYAIKSQPGHGVVTVSGNSAHYVPAADFNGSDSFTYTVDNGLLRSSPAIVSITINAVNDAPRATISGPTTLAEAADGLYTANAVDPEGDPIFYVWTTTNGTIVGTSGIAHLTVDDGPGSARITLTVRDSFFSSRQVTRDVTVTNVAPTVSGGGPRSVFWGVPLTLSGTSTDPSAADRAAGFATRWSFGDRTLDATAATVSHVYTTAGSYSASFKATDKDGASGTATVAVTVGKRTTSIAYTGSSGTTPFGYSVLSARLADTVDAATGDIANRRITFTVGLQTYVANTDASGGATVALTSPLSPGTYSVTARFTGDTAYNLSTAPAVSLKVGSSVGTVSGAGLVSVSNGARASFSVSSIDAVTVRGSLSYTAGVTTISAITLTPMGIASDGRSSWFAGVSTTGQQLRVYVEDRGPGPASDSFQLWVNGALQTGNGALSAGDVTISRL